MNKSVYLVANTKNLSSSDRRLIPCALRAVISRRRRMIIESAWQKSPHSLNIFIDILLLICCCVYCIIQMMMVDLVDIPLVDFFSSSSCDLGHPLKEILLLCLSLYFHLNYVLPRVDGPAGILLLQSMCGGNMLYFFWNFILASWSCILTMTSDVCDDARTINFFVKTLNTLTLPSTLGGCLLAHKSIRYIFDTNNKSNNINHDSQRRFHLRG